MKGGEQDGGIKRAGREHEQMPAVGVDMFHANRSAKFKNRSHLGNQTADNRKANVFAERNSMCVINTASGSENSDF